MLYYITLYYIILYYIDRTSVMAKTGKRPKRTERAHPKDLAQLEQEQTVSVEGFDLEKVADTKIYTTKQ